MDNSFILTEAEFRRLEAEFLIARTEATAFATKYNDALPTEKCPGCGEKDHCPGLACPDCGYVHPVSWAILKDTEWGFDVVALNSRKTKFAVFNVSLRP